MVFVNLFIAVVLKGYALINQKNNEMQFTTLLENFRDSWSKFDPKATEIIEENQI